MEFERWPDSSFGSSRLRSICFYDFKHNFCRVNDVRWSSVYALSFFRENLESGNDVELNVLSKHHREQEEWHLPSNDDLIGSTQILESFYVYLSLVNIASILEVYLRSVLFLSAKSNPKIFTDPSVRVDGALNLKNGLYNDVSSLPNWFKYKRFKSVVCGEWSKRLDALRSFIGDIDVSDSDLKILENAREVRNGFAHNFSMVIEDGYLLDVRNSLVLRRDYSFGHNDLLSLFDVVWRLVGKIEVAILFHVGSYEYVELMHLFLAESRMNIAQYDYDVIRRGFDELLEDRDVYSSINVIGKDYCRGLYDYYRHT